MTRRYKLERIQKNILLGVSGVALASMMAVSGAQTSTGTTATSTKIATTSTTTLKNLQKANRQAYQLCKKDALKEKSREKREADERYASSTKVLKAKRLADLAEVKTATTSVTSSKRINKERQAKRLAIERKYQEELRNLKNIRISERERADKNFENRVCIVTGTGVR